MLEMNRLKMSYKVTTVRLALNYSVCNAISACTYPCETNTLTHSLTRTYLLQLKIHKPRYQEAATGDVL